MATFTDHVDCERCGYPALYELSTGSGEEFVTCQYCGWGYEIFIKAKNGKNLLDDDGNFIYDIIRREPFGALYIEHIEGFGEFQIIDNPITEEDIRTIKSEIEDNPEVDLDATYLARWNEDKEKIEFLIGKERKLPSF